MALIDVIKYDGNAIAWKFQRDDISLGAQLIVNDSQEAIFVKDGKGLGTTFGAGRHELSTKNLPFLRNLLKLPFGGQTPFAAEVWFVNKEPINALKWGTKEQLAVKEQRNDREITVYIGAYGEWGIRITDTQNFITEFVGAQPPGSDIGSEEIKKDLTAAIQQRLQVELRKFFNEKEVSVFEAEEHYDELAESIKGGINPKFQRYGIEIESFYVEKITIPEKFKELDLKIAEKHQELDLGKMEKLQEIDLKKIERDIEYERIAQTPDAYTVKRQFDVLEKTAENPGSGAGQLLGSGFGLGVGLSAGVSMGQKIGSAMDTQPQTENPTEQDDNPDSSESVENQPQTGNPAERDPQNDPVAKLQQLKEMLDSELITEAEFNEKKKQILDSM